MPVAISVKGKELSAWRVAGNGVAAFREALLNRTGAMLADRAETLFVDVEGELKRRAETCENLLASLRRLADEAAATETPVLLQPLVAEHYAGLYGFFEQYRSATAFYGLSGEFLRAVSLSIVGYAAREVGLSPGTLPPVALIALGPAGRHEFSPFCRQQLLVVHGDVDCQPAGDMERFCQIVHEAFDSAGLRPDGTITPRNPEWRGSVSQWNQRMTSLDVSEGERERMDFIRLSSQATLFCNGELDEEFKGACMGMLRKNRARLGFMAERLVALSNGIGIMGGFRLERHGPGRGLFRLLEHALVPLSAVVGGFAVIKGVDETGTRQRIRELLVRGHINVELAERLLEAWHLFNELRLVLEAAAQPDWTRQNILYLDVAGLGADEQERFKEALESLPTLQRQIGIAFSVWEEQSPC